MNLLSVQILIIWESQKKMCMERIPLVIMISVDTIINGGLIGDDAIVAEVVAGRIPVKWCVFCVRMISK